MNKYFVYNKDLDKPDSDWEYLGEYTSYDYALRMIRAWLDSDVLYKFNYEYKIEVFALKRFEIYPQSSLERSE